MQNMEGKQFSSWISLILIRTSSRQWISIEFLYRLKNNMNSLSFDKNQINQRNKSRILHHLQNNKNINSEMKSISKSLHSNPRQALSMVEQGDTSLTQNSSFKDNYQATATQFVMEDSLSDQNQPIEISNQSPKVLEKQLNNPSNSRRSDRAIQRRPSPKKKEKKYDHNLQIIGKILFSIFIVCVLLGLCTMVLEKILSNKCSMPTDSSGAEDKLMALYNSRDNKLDKKELTYYQEVRADSLENNAKITDQATTSMNLKSDEKKGIEKKQSNEKTLTSQTPEKNQAPQTTSIGNLVRKTTPNQAQTPFIPSDPVDSTKKIFIPEPQCSKWIQQQRSKYGSLYTFSVNRNIFRSNSNVNHFAGQTVTQITKEKYVEAFDLLQAIHNVDEKGNVIAEDTPCESGESLSTRLKIAIQKNTERLNREYKMDSYFNNQLRFCIVSNSYKNAQNGLFYRNIDSILQQNYTNYHVVYTDDNSPDQTGQKVKKYLSEKNISQDKIKVKINDKKIGMMENIYNAITYGCQDGEIAVMLDGDDSFIGTNVLPLLNALYQQKKVALMWNNFLQVNSNSRASKGFSRAMNDFGNNFKSYRISKRFVSTHLKSFYVDLFKKIKVSDLQDNTGNFYGGASDTAMMMPMLEMSYPRFEYVPEVVYEYRYDTGQVGMTVNRVPQGIALTKIGLTEPYKSLTDFSFVDEALAKVQAVNDLSSQKTQNK